MTQILYGPEPFTAADNTDLNGYHGLSTLVSSGSSAKIVGNKAVLAVDCLPATDGKSRFACGLNVPASLMMGKFNFSDSNIYSFTTIHRKQGTYGTGSYYAYIASAIPNSHGDAQTNDQTVIWGKQVAGSYSVIAETGFTLNPSIDYYWASWVSGTGLHLFCGTSPWDLKTWSLEITDPDVTGTGECEVWHGDHVHNTDSVTRSISFDDFIIYDSIPSEISRVNHHHQQLRAA